MSDKHQTVHQLLSSPPEFVSAYDGFKFFIKESKEDLERKKGILENHLKILKSSHNIDSR